MPLLSTVDAIVGELNDDIYDSLGSNCKDSYCFIVDYHCDGYMVVIEFLGLQIWSSDDDDREFNEEENKYEPLKPYLIKKIINVINVLSTITFNGGF